MAEVGKAEIRIRALQVAIITNRAVVAKKWGTAWGWDVNNYHACKADIVGHRISGLGIAWQGLTRSTAFSCNKDCPFEDGDEITITTLTFILFKIYWLTLRFCETREFRLRAGLGLGLGVIKSKWKIANTRSWT
jgi:hypothetical protein